MSIKKFSGKELTKALKELAMEAHDTTPTGDVVTRAQALAKALWEKALGGKKKRWVNSMLMETDEDPQAWAIQMVYERLEGKVAQSILDEGGKIRTADKVGELTKQRLNALATGKTAPPNGPPKLPPKG